MAASKPEIRVTRPVDKIAAKIQLLYPCFRVQATWLHYCGDCGLWTELDLSLHISACIHECNEIQTAIRMFLGSSNTTRLLRRLIDECISELTKPRDDQFASSPVRELTMISARWPDRELTSPRFGLCVIDYQQPCRRGVLFQYWLAGGASRLPSHAHILVHGAPLMNLAWGPPRASSGPAPSLEHKKNGDAWWAING